MTIIHVWLLCNCDSLLNVYDEVFWYLTLRFGGNDLLVVSKIELYY